MLDVNTLFSLLRNDFGVEMLFNVLQKNFGQEPWFQPYLYQIRMEDFVTSILLEKLTEFEGKLFGPWLSRMVLRKG